ncbi:hypothetical protein NIM87_00720 [Devosia sp. XJ19-1]|uniref:DUF6894 domain-containing protein n=1 Tax=Devosia ureilytica TaxID=2952754 RepID=A0A9Q4AL40_9HYPH|nr:hypothetical protein [Devosia ureilytica]MCP8882021.1 hypothetical protein [Devosia ureilytica]MCP8886093.1 hypothetical protein [Devosia ureilytica]
MERYFFNHRDAEGHLETDIDGIVLPSLNTALEEASFAARSALALADDPTGGCFEIEDGGRRLLARLPYALATDPDSDA